MSRPSALVVIDMQRQFTTPDGPFLVPDADGVVERVRAAVDAARTNGTPVIWIMQHVRPGVGGGRTSRRYNEPNIHRGVMAELDDRLEFGDDIVVFKHRQSGFYGTDLESILRSLDVDTVIMAGVTTNVCVLATGIDAGARDFGVVLATDLTASLPVRKDGGLLLAADDVQAAAEAFFLHALGSVAHSSEIDGLAR
jgi:nicotinamidase-related amidase